jgi:DNA polymerase-3 subunit chi
LINLQLGIPDFFSRFQRVAEVVTQEPASLSALRESWKFYKERGYQLEKHDL